MGFLLLVLGGAALVGLAAGRRQGAVPPQPGPAPAIAGTSAPAGAASPLSGLFGSLGGLLSPSTSTPAPAGQPSAPTSSAPASTSTATAAASTSPANVTEQGGAGLESFGQQMSAQVFSAAMSSINAMIEGKEAAQNARDLLRRLDSAVWTAAHAGAYDSQIGQGATNLEVIRPLSNVGGTIGVPLKVPRLAGYYTVHNLEQWYTGRQASVRISAGFTIDPDAEGVSTWFVRWLDKRREYLRTHPPS